MDVCAALLGYNTLPRGCYIEKHRFSLGFSRVGAEYVDFPWVSEGSRAETLSLALVLRSITWLSFQSLASVPVAWLVGLVGLMRLAVLGAGLVSMGGPGGRGGLSGEG